jgi:GNAT superfamily N-acetyltransferase
MTAINIRPLEGSDREWIADLLTKRWGSLRVVSRGRLYHPNRLPGFVAERKGESVGEPIGLVTYEIENAECQIVLLDSLVEGEGIGTSLIEAVREIAILEKCHRLWLITTNDNIEALRFYQRRGLAIAAVYPNSLEQARKLKPEIPATGKHGIPLRDEIELEILLSN